MGVTSLGRYVQAVRYQTLFPAAAPVLRTGERREGCMDKGRDD